MKFSIRTIILTGIFAAITAICAQISIPLPFSQVPITLQLLAVFLSAVILGGKYGALSQIVYILIGSVGVPVFAGFHGGFNVIVGPTGGFLLSFPIIALLIGLIIEKNKNVSVLVMRFLVIPLILLLGLVICYSLGAVWFSFIQHISLNKAILLVVLPYVPLDIIKIIFVSLLGYKIRDALLKAKLIN